MGSYLRSKAELEHLLRGYKVIHSWDIGKQAKNVYVVVDNRTGHTLGYGDTVEDAIAKVRMNPQNQSGGIYSNGR